MEKELKNIFSFDEIFEMIDNETTIDDLVIENIVLDEEEQTMLAEAEGGMQGLGSVKWLMADGKVNLIFQLAGASKAVEAAKEKGDKSAVEKAKVKKKSILEKIKASAEKGKEKYKNMDPKKKKELDTKAEAMKNKLQ